MKNKKLIKGFSVIALIASLFLLAKNLPNSTMAMMSAGTFTNFLENQPTILWNIVLYAFLTIFFIFLIFRMGDTK